MTENNKENRKSNGTFLKGYIPWNKGKKGVYSKKTLEIMSSSSRKYSLNQDYFNQPLDETRAYWIGFLIADGGIVDNQVSLNLKDKDHIEKFRIAINYGGLIGYRSYKGLYGRKERYDGWSLQVRSNKMVDSLAKFGIVSRKSFKTYIPNLPQSLLKPLFRGLVDGDGCIFKTNQGWWGLNLVGTKQIVTSFKIWINKQTKNTKGSISKKEKIWIVRFGGNPSTWEVVNLLYKDASQEIRLERKYFKYLEFKKEYDRSK